MNATQGDARIGFESILAFQCVVANVDALITTRRMAMRSILLNTVPLSLLSEVYCSTSVCIILYVVKGGGGWTPGDQEVLDSHYQAVVMQ